MSFEENFDTLHEQLLVEQPWVEFTDLLDDGESVIWDFCAEEKGWLRQLYDLYTKHEMTSMDNMKNVSRKLRVTDTELANVTSAMLKDIWFRKKFVADFKKLPDSEKLKFEEILPAEYMELI